MTVLDGVDLTASGRPAPDRTTSVRTTSVRTDGDRAAADRTVAERAAVARAALARAELRTGARSTRSTASGVGAGPVHGTASAHALARPTGPAAGTVAVPVPVPEHRAAGSVPGTSVPVRSGTVAPVPASGPLTPASSLTHPDRPPLPVAPALAGLLPDGALRRGASLVVTGSTSLLLGLVAHASQEGSWVAVVGLPAVGLLAAQQAGVVLDRLALVPRPGPDAPTVLAALLDGVDLVVVGDDAALVDSDRRRLTARARERGTVLMSTTSWPGAHVVLSAEPVEWTGLGAGYGHLSRHRVAVTRGGRGSAGRGGRTEVVLPVRPQDVPATTSATATRSARTAPVPAPLRMVG